MRPPGGTSPELVEEFVHVLHLAGKAARRGCKPSCQCRPYSLSIAPQPPWLTTTASMSFEVECPRLASAIRRAPSLSAGVVDGSRRSSPGRRARSRRSRSAVARGAVAQWAWRNMASATQPTKNATRARRRPTAGKNCGQLRPAAGQRRQERHHAAQPAGNQSEQPHRSARA